MMGSVRDTRDMLCVGSGRNAARKGGLITSLSFFNLPCLYIVKIKDAWPAQLSESYRSVQGMYDDNRATFFFLV
jgi:hypothetical protein